MNYLCGSLLQDRELWKEWITSTKLQPCAGFPQLKRNMLQHFLQLKSSGVPLCIGHSLNTDVEQSRVTKIYLLLLGDPPSFTLIMNTGTCVTFSFLWLPARPFSGTHGCSYPLNIRSQSWSQLFLSTVLGSECGWVVKEGTWLPLMKAMRGPCQDKIPTLGNPWYLGRLWVAE